MDLSPADVETDLIDLSEVSLTMMRQCDRGALADSVARLLKQVDRPRSNLGGTAPPGRID